MLGGELNAPRRLASEQPSDEGAESSFGGLAVLCAAFVSLEASPRHYALPHASTTAAPSLTRSG